MILGTGALSTRPLSDPVSVQTVIPNPLPEVIHLYPDGIIIAVQRDVAVLPTFWDSANVGKITDTVQLYPPEGVVRLEPAQGAIVREPLIGCIVIHPVE